MSDVNELYKFFGRREGKIIVKSRPQKHLEFLRAFYIARGLDFDKSTDEDKVKVLETVIGAFLVCAGPDGVGNDADHRASGESKLLEKLGIIT